MTNDEDDVIVTNCLHRNGPGKACSICLLEAVQELQIQQKRATEEIYDNWVKEQGSTTLKPHCEKE